MSIAMQNRDVMKFAAPGKELAIDLAAIVAYQREGGSITIHATGGPIKLDKDGPGETHHRVDEAYEGRAVAQSAEQPD